MSKLMINLNRYFVTKDFFVERNANKNTSMFPIYVKTPKVYSCRQIRISLLNKKLPNMRVVSELCENFKNIRRLMFIT